MGRNAASTGAIIDPMPLISLNPNRCLRRLPDTAGPTVSLFPQCRGICAVNPGKPGAGLPLCAAPIEEISGRKITQIILSAAVPRNQVLCQFAADAYRAASLCGPVEATAIGNILVQANGIRRGESHPELRDIVKQSFPLIAYEPQRTGNWDERYARFLQIKGKENQDCVMHKIFEGRFRVPSFYFFNYSVKLLALFLNDIEIYF